ncbi:hypothetical protein TrVE_jg6294 [Triparma verrucosa]|uniref:Uncharacterized protein n=1 Tax=Triparma verrucosa TaxID=1606542 RepID=A0A9W7F0L0_9STRA|nr:hypothetical protein TrVE_jg6294 [Triparma verrucosa]
MDNDNMDNDNMDNDKESHLIQLQEEYDKINQLRLMYDQNPDALPNLQILDQLQPATVTYENLKSNNIDLLTLGSILLISKIRLPALPNYSFPTSDLSNLRQTLSKSLLLTSGPPPTCTLNPSTHPSLSSLLSQLKSQTSHLNTLVKKLGLQPYGSHYVSELPGKGSKKVGKSRSGVGSIGVFERLYYIKDGGGGGGSYFNVVEEYNTVEGGEGTVVLLDEGGGYTEEEVGGKILNGYLDKWSSSKWVVTTHNNVLRSLRSESCIHFVGEGTWIKGSGGARFSALKGIVDPMVLESIDVDWKVEEAIDAELDRIEKVRIENEFLKELLDKKTKSAVKTIEASVSKLKNWEDKLESIDLTNLDVTLQGSTLSTIRSVLKKSKAKLEKFKDGIDVRATVVVGSVVVVIEGVYAGEIGRCVRDKISTKLIEIDFGGGVVEEVWIDDWMLGVFSEKGGGTGWEMKVKLGKGEGEGPKKKVVGNSVKSSRERKSKKKR